MRVYFYCHPCGPPDKAAYQHAVVCLAEGLQQLGVEYHASTDYWRTPGGAQEYLLKRDPDVHAGDCDVVVMNDVWLHYGKQIPAELFGQGRGYRTVFIQGGAWVRYHQRPEMRQFDIILKCHCNKRIRYPDNVVPWAFGLSHRILSATEDAPPRGNRNHAMLCNFRVAHDVREDVQQHVLPLLEGLLPVDSTTDDMETAPQADRDRLMWRQTGRRHHPAYYRRLRETTACACFGGCYSSFWRRDGRHREVLRRITDMLDYRPPAVESWDSWRFWEAMAAGCVALHVDFDAHGLALPAKPENWRHYVGVNLKRPRSAINRLGREPSLLERISVEGRTWVRERYSPAATAKRFLELMG